LEHRASNPVSIKNLNATETSATAWDGVKLLRPYVPVRTRRRRRKRRSGSSGGILRVFYFISPSCGGTEHGILLTLL
jgi:hypothetical protein